MPFHMALASLKSSAAFAAHVAILYALSSCGALILAVAWDGVQLRSTAALGAAFLAALVFAVVLRWSTARLPSAALRRVAWHFGVMSAAVLGHTAAVNDVSATHVALPLLRDVGFSLISARPELHRVSDAMAHLSLVALGVRCLSMLVPGCWGERRVSALVGDAHGDARVARGAEVQRHAAAARMVEEWLRVMSTVYACRAPLFWATRLPGPAVHCHASSTARAAAAAAVVAAARDESRVLHHALRRLAPAFGGGGSCGDLVFSGHAAFLTVNLLLLCRHTRALSQRACGSRSEWAGFIAVALFVGTAGLLIVVSRQHYTVDVLLGAAMGYLLFCRFVDGWWRATPPPPPLMHASSRTNEC